MNIGIIGLGLIGGSMAKAFKKFTDYDVLGYDLNPDVLKMALEEKSVDKCLDNSNISNCDIVLIALYPADTVEFVKLNAQKFKSGAVVMDLCGVKDIVCSELRDFVKDFNFIYIGAHPMAGLEFSGYCHSNAHLFQNASMILTPEEYVPKITVDKIRDMFLHIGFSEIKITTSKEHDKIIAYTSQLAHVVSNAYVKSPTALLHHGFSAGSYKDLTRVARLNENMWTELFLDNSEALVNEIDGLIEQLAKYRNAVYSKDREELKELLKAGREIKEQVDKDESDNC